MRVAAVSRLFRLLASHMAPGVPFRSPAVRYLATVFVSRIPWTAAANEVKEHFSQFGTVRRCFLPFERETGFHKGCCWIGFSSEEELQRTLQQENHFIDGVKVHVQRQRHRHRDTKEQKDLI